MWNFSTRFLGYKGRRKLSFVPLCSLFFFTAKIILVNGWSAFHWVRGLPMLAKPSR